LQSSVLYLHSCQNPMFFSIISFFSFLWFKGALSESYVFSIILFFLFLWFKGTLIDLARQRMVL
jgi:hypothetical protein